MLSDQLLSDRPLSDSPMTGFGAWLAGRLVPLAQRRRVHLEVQRFLAWQDTEFPYDAAMQRPAVWCYLLKRQREGCDDAEALRLWGALELFLHYLDSRSADSRSADTRGADSRRADSRSADRLA